ncbi:MAG: hypothetical protein J2P23_02980 [Microlunatus sp.]|nr:hypothetical protein [Microlunatus sp.]
MADAGYQTDASGVDGEYFLRIPGGPLNKRALLVLDPATIEGYLDTIADDAVSALGTAASPREAALALLEINITEMIESRGSPLLAVGVRNGAFFVEYDPRPDEPLPDEHTDFDRPTRRWSATPPTSPRSVDGHASG